MSKWRFGPDGLELMCQICGNHIATDYSMIPDRYGGVEGTHIKVYHCHQCDLQLGSIQGSKAEDQRYTEEQQGRKFGERWSIYCDHPESNRELDNKGVV